MFDAELLKNYLFVRSEKKMKIRFDTKNNKLKKKCDLYVIRF